MATSPAAGGQPAARGSRPGTAPSGPSSTAAAVGGPSSTAPSSTAASSPAGASSSAPADRPAIAAWAIPGPPEVNYLAGPGLLISTNPAAAQSTAETATAGGRLTPLLQLRGYLAAVVADPSGGLWYVAAPSDGTLLWSNGSQVRVLSWRSALPQAPVGDLQLASGADGSAWLVVVTPTVPGGRPENLLGVGDAGGRAIAIHASLTGGIQSYDLPPLAGSDITALAVGPDGRLWFTTADADGSLRSLYSYDPGTKTLQSYPIPSLGGVLNLDAAPSGVWLRVEAAVRGPVLLQVDPAGGAIATVLRDVTSLAVSPAGTLFAAVQTGDTGTVYSIDAAGSPTPLIDLPQPATGLAADARSLWALTAVHLYRRAD